jgi:hypothetical protein
MVKADGGAAAAVEEYGEATGADGTGGGAEEGYEEYDDVGGAVPVRFGFGLKKERICVNGRVDYYSICVWEETKPIEKTPVTVSWKTRCVFFGC